MSAPLNILKNSKHFTTVGMQSPHAAYSFIVVILLINLSCNDERTTSIYNDDGLLVRRTYHESKIITEQTFKNDTIQHGYLRQYYFPSGQLELEVTFKEGVKQGTTKAYYKSGNTKIKGYYNKGEIDGVYLQYYESGNLKEKNNWKLGIPFGEHFEYFENGKLHKYQFYDMLGKLSYNSEYGRDGSFVKETGSLFPVIMVGNPSLKTGDLFSADIHFKNPPNYKISLYYGFGDKNEWENIQWSELLAGKNPSSIKYEKTFNKSGVFYWKLKLVVKNLRGDEQEIKRGLEIEVL